MKAPTLREVLVTATALAIGVAGTLASISACSPQPSTEAELTRIYQEAAQAVADKNVNVYNALACEDQRWTSINTVYDRDNERPDSLNPLSLKDFSVHTDVALARVDRGPEKAYDLYKADQIAFRKENGGWKYCGGITAVGITAGQRAIAPAR
ncbi:hypothetical protein FZI91_23620 [Mycobacterium sp. CBMA271]|uniref:hypothetical protein n=1 Tax=unclassified Mycobacteroides TaxID=2618759 RepID=UPI0012DF33EB|nr:MULTISPECIES: hypothetical protein [unclassified Mycobacteroides]MUM17538.1 hypothetical protein [Mycobacteroides sp. CBMA 326]MUM24669.1 hypothetical protein [Mycobacteroides sp. CBMA 271]